MPLAHLDVSEAKALLRSLPPAVWTHEYQAAHSAVMGGRDSNMNAFKPGVMGITLLFSAGSGEGTVFKFPLYEKFAPVLEPLLEEVRCAVCVARGRGVEEACMQAAAHPAAAPAGMLLRRRRPRRSPQRRSGAPALCAARAAAAARAVCTARASPPLLPCTHPPPTRPIPAPQMIGAPDMANIIRLQLALMSPNVSDIRIHVDTGGYATHAHRLHIPLMTNPGVSFDLCPFLDDAKTQQVRPRVGASGRDAVIKRLRHARACATPVHVPTSLRTTTAISLPPGLPQGPHRRRLCV